MDATDYMLETRKTAMYGQAVESPHDQINYCLLGLVGETGEIAEKFKKRIRSGERLDTFIGDVDIARELGDVCWYLARLGDELNFDFSIILQMNVAKLHDRRERGVIQGEGDNR